MTSSDEVELKYGVDPGRVDAVAAALRRAGATLQRLESRYFDSSDERLGRHGFSLRLRHTASGWEQTLKGPASPAWVRSEDTVPRPDLDRPGAAAASARQLPADLALHRSIVGVKARRRLGRGGGLPPTLLERHASEVERLAVEIEVDVAGKAARVEVAFDRGRIVAGERSAAVCEVEYELKHGAAAALLGVARQGVEEHGLWLAVASKAARGARLAAGDVAAPVKASRPRLVAASSGRAIVVAAVASCHEQIAANQAALAAGDRRDEFVHQLRVGLRRLRSAARELKGLDPIATGPWLEAITTAFRALGDDRDRRVVLPALVERLRRAGSPAPDRLDVGVGADVGVDGAAEADPGAVVRRSAFQQALLDLVELQLAPPSDAVPPSAARVRIGRRLDRLHARLRRAGKRFARADPEAQHRVRKDAKRLRYLAELVGSLYEDRAVDRYLKRLKPVQDALGSHVDLLTGQRYAREAAFEADAGLDFNLAWIEDQLSTSADACAEALRHAARARPFWQGQRRARARGA